MEDFYGIRKLIANNGGIKGFRCFAQLGLIDAIFPCFGFGIVDSNKRTWVECCIDESRYKVEDGYKITLRPFDTRACKEDYYQSDFMSLIKSGHIIIKDENNENKRIEHVIWAEPLCGSAIVINEADIVI